MSEIKTLAQVLNGRDTISTKDARIYTKINGKVRNMIECNKFSAKWEKNKEDVQTLGSRIKRKKVTGVEGTGSLGGYLVASNWMKYAMPYVRGGKDLYFEVIMDIEDPTSAAGKQSIQLLNVNLDDIPIADFEADDGVMEFETDFTFEDSQLLQPFTGFED